LTYFLELEYNKNMLNDQDVEKLIKAGCKKETDIYGES
jgi:hypothetical protein